MRARSVMLAVPVAVMALVSSSAWAQPASSERALDDQRRLSEGVRETDAASRAAMERGLTGGPEVTWEQVRRNPDDPGLNAAWARTQIMRGDLLGASATLERILMRYPAATEARLVHGLVLFRLDDTTTAKSELESIDPAQLTPAQRAERDQVLAQIEQRTKRLRQAVTIALGSHFDSNRNSSPSSGEILINNLPFTLEGSAEKRADWGRVGVASYEFDYDLGTDPRLSLFGALNLLGDRQSTLKTYDTVAGGATTGVRYVDGPIGAQFGAFWNSMAMNDDYYLSDYGLDGRFTYRLAPAWEAFTTLRLDRQVFHNISSDQVATDSSGVVLTSWFGGVWHPDEAHNVSLSAGFARRNAAAGYMSNDRWAGRLGDTWLLGKGQFISAVAELGVALYDKSNPTFSSQIRRDSDGRFDLTYGVPVGTVAETVGLDAPDQLREVILSVTGEYYRSLSNLPNYTYANLRTQALVSRRWEF
ncbi:tetratricopeptide repeat protein [Magnetospirillum molischianum]|uniref:Uncharacterized protein n=1 Tax=Magnetospirillum molischianum DSM 120 TaxID=1150626 RepID=H8FMY2_MAGML|nr:surface lipoprotein assembly modifier [Magnetospirillum molischianum]CCG39720.1 exported hypothetical protein [Magnetospirillum molischianum DSM 120]